MSAREKDMPFVAGVVLAAGRSRRFGGERPKQLAEIEDRPLVRRVTEAAMSSRLAQVIVVLGHAARAVEEVLEGLDCVRVVNPDHARGLSTSVRRGLAAADPRARAAIFLPADQPWLDAVLIDALLGVYAATGGPIVAPTYRGRRGAPVIFDRQVFAELRALEGDVGGREVLKRRADEVVRLEIGNPRALDDVDTPDDLDRLRTPESDRSGEFAK